jgi:type I restriction enzyme, S subunit
MSSELRKLWEHAGGHLPDDWTIVPLESLLRDSKSISVGVMYPGPDTPGGTPLLKVGDIKDGAAIRPSYCISAATDEEHRRTKLIGDELLITLVGNPGECVVVTPAMKGWNPARAIAVIRLQDTTLRTYLKTVLESTAGRHLIDAVLNTTVQKTLNLKDVRKLPIPLPKDTEIEWISGISESLTSRITLLRETNATLEAIAQALFKSWFVDFDPVRAKMEGRTPEGMDEATAALFPDSFEESELGLVPRGWATRTMADISVVGIGKTPPRKEQHWFSEASSDVRWVSIRDMGAIGVYASRTSEFLTQEAVNKFNVRQVPNNTVLMSFKMTIGRVAITDGEMTTNEAIAHFKLAPDAPLATEYIYLHLKQFDFSTLSSTSSIADAVNSKTVREIPILVPTPDVVAVFQSQVGVLFAKLKNTEQHAQTLTNLRDTLLPRLISGQLRLPEAQQEMEDALP